MNTLNFEKSLHALIFKWFKYVMIFLMAEDIFSTPRRVRTAVTLFLASAFVIGVDGLSQRLLGIEVFLGRPMGLIQHSFPGAPTHTYHGITASFKHYNDFGTYLICPLLLLTAFLVSGRPQKHFLAGILSVGVLVLGLCLWLTFSRGAWFAFAAGLFLMLFLSGKKPVVWILSGFFLIPAAAWPAFRERLLFFFISPYGASERAAVWGIAWRMIHEAPFLGKGLGTFMDICSLYSSGAIVKYAHNCYLQMWAETGLFSVISFAGFSGSILYQGVVLYKKTSNVLFLGLICALFAFLVHCFLDTGLYSVQLSVLFWLLSGLLAALISTRAALARNPE